MQRNSNKTSMATLAAKPPRPPCWTDFVSSSQKDSESIGDPSTDGGKLPNRSSGGCQPSIALKSSKPAKRVRAKLHRTRSEYAIPMDELPEEALTVNLADTKPKEFGLNRQVYPVYDDRVYKEENTRRCQNWLASIEAYKPFDEVSALSGGDGVELEIPDEIGEDPWGLKPPHNTSGSSSEDDKGRLKRKKTTLTPLKKTASTYSSDSMECKFDSLDLENSVGNLRLTPTKADMLAGNSCESGIE